MEVEMETPQFIEREYQTEILCIAKQKNCIAFLPTGSGKTFIAILLIKSRCSHFGKTIGEGGKRSYFLVNTVNLVEQQSPVLQRMMSYPVGMYTGEMDVDAWSTEKWKDEIDAHQVLVMTTQIFLNLLQRAMVKMTEVATIIFDECHHAVGSHPMRQVMTNFYDESIGEMPRILGLTATLLNASVTRPDDVLKVLEGLEQTFHASIITSNLVDQVKMFSTNPIEEKVYYETNNTPNTVLNYCLKVTKELWKGEGKSRKSRIFVDKSNAPKRPNAILKNDSRLSFINKAVALLDDTAYHIESFGLTGGYVSSLLHIVSLVRFEITSKHTSDTIAAQVVKSKLMDIRNLIRKEVYDMNLESRKLLNISSDSVIKLYEILKTLNREDKCLIFVKRRSTAKVLYHIFKDADLPNITVDFVVGVNLTSLRDNKDGFFQKKVQNQILKEFNKKGGLNVLITTDILEEGTDIEACNYVIKFDSDLTFRSYVQSKGRARNITSKFFLFLPKNDLRCESNYYKFIQVEKKLRQYLDQIDGSSETTDEQEVLSYTTPSGAKVTAVSAMNVINKYCSMLPQDSFCNLSPYFWEERTFNGEKVCVIQFPLNSPIKDAVVGDCRHNWKEAKQVACLKAVTILHQQNELDDNFQPIICSMTEDDPKLHCPHWVDDEIDGDASGAARGPKIGTKKRIREITMLDPLTNDREPIMPNSNLYLHSIATIPNFDSDSITNDYDRELYMSHYSYGFLTTYELPPISEFPLFVSSGNLSIKIEPNVAKIQLDDLQLDALKRFHKFLFMDVLKLVKPYLSWMDDSCTLLVVPISRDVSWNGILEANIEWEVVLTLGLNNERPGLNTQAAGESKQTSYKSCDWSGVVVIPWYRESENYYMVLDVCTNMSPLSQFPHPKCKTFKEYFQKVHNIEITDDNQPLLLVRNLPTGYNFIKPRVKKSKSADTRMQVYMVPELCIKQDFHLVYWLKAALIPTIIDRLGQILRSIELMGKISSIHGINMNRTFGTQVQSFDSYVYHEQEEHRRKEALDLAKITGKLVLRNAVEEDDDEDGPIDIERNLNTLTIAQLNFHAKEYDSVYEKVEDDQEKKKEEDKPRPFQERVIAKARAPPLTILKSYPEPYTEPKQYHIIEALTTNAANDIFNMERLETLGDSFLKLAVSLTLFLTTDKFNEGQLTMIKGMVVGNRNLFHVSSQFELAKYMKISEFSPSAYWKPPGFGVPENLIPVFEWCPKLLPKCILTREEQITGYLSSSTCDKVVDIVQNFEGDEEEENHRMINYFNKQYVNDKTCADGFEALIGVYLQRCGIKCSYYLLKHFGIVSNKIVGSIDDLLKSTLSVSKKPPNSSNNLIAYDDIEDTIGYKFKNRGYLLQALTHASYIGNMVTDCYQTLEFIGDAVLDFLITGYIYEYCGVLSPGELTDLRSALVNNVTFATIAVKCGLHKSFLANSTKILNNINAFVKLQEECDYRIGDEMLYSVTDGETNTLEYVDVPKVLGDIFESIAGAILLDSCGNLEVVWNVFYRLMKEEIKLFSKCVPKNPIRVMYELYPNAKYGSTVNQLFGKIKIPLTVVSPKDLKSNTVYGCGINKQNAKRAAAKLAIKLYH